MSQVTSQTDPLLLSDRVERSSGSGLLRDLSTLTKPRITLLVALTAYVGFALAGPTHVSVIWALAGTVLSCMGSAALNQFLERDVDARMKRTRNRPLPAGRMSPQMAATIGVALAATGVGILAVFTSLLAAGLAMVTVLSYVLVYTPLKRVHSVSVIIGAIPGALPPVIGCAAAVGMVNQSAIAAFLIMFIWQLPHTLAIAWLWRDDFARAGFRVLPVMDPTGQSTARQMTAGAIALIPVSLVPAVMGGAGWWYTGMAFLAGVAFFVCTIVYAIRKDQGSARLVFLASLVYLPLVLILMMVDRN